ncbi:structural protein [Acinetobacter phage VB_ApiP_XC38]|uniref:Structural protein n=1 Tax=Acinetobacter phage VB_ApiP_XC38 TaxID=2655002 RepID=A0A5P8PR04_9CAUD|nr:structural protein [Acinetobacter phage VB_ApiP_XC38]QFR59699.1 structural protein [Acinetobacter phage VB_ApiP_XC38]
MNYPFLGYNTPGLQLGQDSWMTAATPAYQPLTTTPTPFANAVQPWQSDLSSAMQNNTYSALGLNSDGLYTPSPSSGGLANWLSGNTELVKAGVGLLTGGMSAWNGFQQNRLLKSNMNMQANQFREQMDLSKSNYNSKLEDRQRARVASNPTAYESVDSYMKKYGAK